MRSRLKSKWEHDVPQAEFNRKVAAGSPEHTRHIFLLRLEITEHVAAARKTIAESRALMAKVDTMLACGRPARTA